MSGIAKWFWKPFTDDELYKHTVFLLITIREQAKDRTDDGFDACVRNLQHWMDGKCEVEKKKLTGAQVTYVDTVRKKCEAQPSKVRSIVDQLIVAREAEDPGSLFASVTELDSVFMPLGGEDGCTVLKRAM